MAGIGLVGLGSIGAPMAQNLLQDGHDLKVHDTSLEFYELLYTNREQKFPLEMHGHR